MKKNLKIGLLTLLCAAAANASPLASLQPLAETPPASGAREGSNRSSVEPLYSCQLPKDESIGLKEEMYVIVYKEDGKLNLVVADKEVKKGIPFKEIKAMLVSEEEQVKKLLADENVASFVKLSGVSDNATIKKIALFSKEKAEGSEDKTLPMALFVFADSEGKSLGAALSLGGGALKSPCNMVNR